jgi:hypothetical protein
MTESDPSRTLTWGLFTACAMFSSMLDICSIGIGTQNNYALDIRLQGRIVTARWRSARNMIRERAASVPSGGHHTLSKPSRPRIGVRSDALTSKELCDDSACPF